MKVAENQRWLQALVLALPHLKRPLKIPSCVWEHTVKIYVKDGLYLDLTEMAVDRV
jgi:hypothetical protein